MEGIYLRSYLAMLIGPFPSNIYCIRAVPGCLQSTAMLNIVTGHFHLVLVMLRGESVIRECTIKFSSLLPLSSSASL